MNAVVKVRPRRVAKMKPPVSMLEVIERASKDPAVDVDKLERLLGMAERVREAERVADFSISMNAAQREVKSIAYDAENTHTRSGYATYEKLDRILRPIYIDNGFSLSFNTEPVECPGIVRVACVVSHRGGHSVTYRIDMPADGKGAQGGDVMTKTHATGSAVSYGMRYLLKMIFNVATRDGDDDDGNAAGTVFITESQAADLRALATEVGANIPAYLKVMKVETFEKIPASRFKDALATLEAKRRAA